MDWNLLKQYLAPDPRNSNVVWTTVVALTLILVIVGLAKWGANPASNTSQASTQRTVGTTERVHASPRDQHSGTVEPNEPPLSIPSAANLDAKLRESDNARFSVRLEQVVKDASELSGQLAAVAKFVEELATNDIGRRIAADERLTQDMIALLSIPNNRAKEITDLVERASDLRIKFEEAIKIAPTLGVSKEAPKLIAEIEQMISDKRTQLQRYRSAIDRIAIDASSKVPSGKTFRTAMDEDTSREAMSLAAAVRTERENALKEKVALARENEIKMKELELQATRVKLEGERKLKEVEIEAAKMAATKGAEDRKLRAEFERDRELIQHYLHPLFVPGETQPGPNGFVRTLEPKPVSLNALKAYGALHSLPIGPTALLFFFNAQENDRKVRGPYPDFIGGSLQSAHAEAIMPAYKLLVKYQHILVREKLLSP